MIPPIEHYPHPKLDTVPQGRADWRIDPQRAALLVHDMQRYFTAPFASSELLEDTTRHIAMLTAAARAHNIPVFYTAQPPNQDPGDRGLLSDLWGTGLSDPHAAGIVDELTPHPGDTVLTKWRYDAFERSPLQQHLAEHGRTQLIITGIYAHIGVLTTATSAFMKDVAPFIVADACADFSEDLHHFALAQAARTCAVVCDTSQVLSAFHSTPPADTHTSNVFSADRA